MTANKTMSWVHQGGCGERLGERTWARRAPSRQAEGGAGENLGQQREARDDQVTHPVGRSHLHHDLRGRPAEVPAVAAHHHGAALAIAQVNRRQHALDEVGQVVALALEKPGGPPQPPAPSGPLVLVGCRWHGQHRDGASLHGGSGPVLPRLPGAGGNLQPGRRGVHQPGGGPELRLAPRPPPRAGPQPAPSRGTDRWILSKRPLAAPAKFGLYLPTNFLSSWMALGARSFSPQLDSLSGCLPQNLFPVPATPSPGGSYSCV